MYKKFDWCFQQTINLFDVAYIFIFCESFSMTTFSVLMLAGVTRIHLGQGDHKNHFQAVCINSHIFILFCGRDKVRYP